MEEGVIQKGSAEEKKKGGAMDRVRMTRERSASEGRLDEM